MENYIKKFYLDTEKDIIINLYKTKNDEITAILTTPNHKSGNLITNLAKLFNVETQKDENGMKIIVVKIPASINGDNKTVYILRLGGFKIANIYEDYTIELKAKITAITKTSQTAEGYESMNAKNIKAVRIVLGFTDDLRIRISARREYLFEFLDNNRYGLFGTDSELAEKPD